jgi:nucleoid-associated protein YgaU
MTRETKIGLLVGLAFIIVIGILLSDHLTSSTEPPQASLGQVGNNVRQTTNSPGTTAPPITAVVPPQQVQPQQPVMTQQEANRPTPVQIIKVGPNNTQPQPQQHTTVAIQPPQQQTQQAPVQQLPQQVADNSQQSNDIPITRTPEVKGTMADVASQMGEPLVGLHGETISPQPANGTLAKDPKPVVVATTAGKQYKAEEGDSVSSIARKFLGGNTKANREAIIKANPSLQQNPDRIIVGKTYLVPNEVAPGQQPAPAPAQQPAVAEKPAQPAPAESTNTTNTGDNIYVVKAGDSLSKIAVMQCGTGAAVTAIKELNKDLLKDSDVIQVGMKLRLPSKPLASAN